MIGLFLECKKYILQTPLMQLDPIPLESAQSGMLATFFCSLKLLNTWEKAVLPVEILCTGAEEENCVPLFYYRY